MEQQKHPCKGGCFRDKGCVDVGGGSKEVRWGEETCGGIMCVCVHKGLRNVVSRSTKL